MGTSGIGATGMMLLIIAGLLLFGPSKLPELGRAIGRTFREFKEGAREMIAEDEPLREQTTAKSSPHLENKHQDHRLSD